MQVLEIASLLALLHGLEFQIFYSMWIFIIVFPSCTAIPQYVSVLSSPRLYNRSKSEFALDCQNIIRMVSLFGIGALVIT